jgi:hypothetical protein
MKNNFSALKNKIKILSCSSNLWQKKVAENSYFFHSAILTATSSRASKLRPRAHYYPLYHQSNINPR